MTRFGVTSLAVRRGLLAATVAVTLAVSLGPIPSSADTGASNGEGGLHLRGPRPVPPPDPFAAEEVRLGQPRLHAQGTRIAVALPVRFADTNRRSSYRVQITVHRRLTDSGGLRGIAQRVIRKGRVTQRATTLEVRLPRAASRHLRDRGLAVPVTRRPRHRDPARLVQIVVQQDLQATKNRPRQLVTAGDDASRPPKQSPVTPPAIPRAKARAHSSHRDPAVTAADLGGNNTILTKETPNDPSRPGTNIPVKVTVSSGTGDTLQVIIFPVACTIDDAVTGLSTTFDSVSESASGTATMLGGNLPNPGTLDLAGLADAYNSWLASEAPGSDNLAVLGGLSPSLSQFYFGQPYAFNGRLGNALQQELSVPGMSIANPSDPNYPLVNGAACGNPLVPEEDDYGYGVDYQWYWTYDWEDGGYAPPDPTVDPAYFFIQVTDIEPTSAAGTSFLSGLISIQPVNEWATTGSSDDGQEGVAALYQPQIYAQFVPIAAGNPGGGGSYACATVTIPDTLDNGAVGVGIQYNLDSGVPTTETTDESGSTCQK